MAGLITALYRHRSAQPRKPRVVIAGQLPPPVGGQNVMIAKTLASLMAEDSLVAEHLDFRFTKSWSRVRAVGFDKALELLRVIGRMVRLRWRGPIDCLLYPVGGPHLVPIMRDMLLLPFCYLVSDKVILHFHAGGIANSLPEFPAVFARLVRRVYSMAFGAVSLTEFGRVDPEALGIREIKVLPNVLDDEYDPSLIAGNYDKVRLLYVGHLCPDKGTPELIGAFARLRSDHPDVELVLLGEPIPPFSADQLERMIEDLKVTDAVLLSGVVHGIEKWKAFASADLFVFPSQAPYESFPLALLEALMWSLPVVTSRWRGLPDVIGQPPPGICFNIDADLEKSLFNALRDSLKQKARWPEWGEQARRRFVDIHRSARGGPPVVDYIGSLVAAHKDAPASPVDWPASNSGEE
jgi:glycosyltransferase involved in cell wall biosynthesis